MQGKTHMMLGAAVATTFLSKYPIESGIILLGSSILGSLIPDIDHPKGKINQKLLPIKNKFFKILVYCLIGVGLNYVSQQTNNILLKLLGILSVLVGISNHRSFTHSILGFILFSRIFYIISIRYNLKPLYVGFMTGYGLHLIADFLTKEGIEILYPCRKNIRAPITINTGGTIEYILLIFSGIYFTYYIINYFKII
jgi:inner membrane protein